MKKLSKVICLVALLVVAVGSIAACGKKAEDKKTGESSSEEKKTVKVGGTEISKIYYDAIVKEYHKLGYKTEFVLFDSNPVVLKAANDGEVDIALGQHAKFVASFDKSNNGDLEVMKPYGFYTGIGLYSEKYKAVDEFPKGAQISIMNDAINMDIAMRVLQDAGLITLKEIPDGATYTVADVDKNPKGIKIVDMEQAQTVRSLDEVDGALVFFTHMYNAGKDPSSYLIRDKELVNCPMGPIVKKGNADQKWAKDFAECLKKESVEKEIDKAFPGVFTFYKSDDEVTE